MWMSGSALAVILLIILVLIVVVITKGLGVFWPHPLAQFDMVEGDPILGEVIQTEPDPQGDGARHQLKIGNRDLYGLDFRWVRDAEIASRSHPIEAVALERLEYGNFYGYIQSVSGLGGELPAGGAWEGLHEARRQVEPILEEAEEVGERMQGINGTLERLRLGILKATYRGAAESDEWVSEMERRRTLLSGEFAVLVAEQEEILSRAGVYVVTMADAAGRTQDIQVSEIVRAYRPNRMSLSAKAVFYAGKIKELLLGEPRESNTEGGLFPAIFGTVMLVFLMSILSFPLGVLAGIYLREYAKEGLLVRLVRIGVNNLAGIPSIVYGIFGLGFFIYGVGGFIDQAFFPERLPTPTFGTGGILWASLTLGLLTVPVVIVSTEEAFGAIPRGIREASLALGATRFQTLYRVLLPMAAPGMITGFILAMARAAGEVAPLMITGVVKLAPALPVDGSWPFLHLDRKFMHLGFHIYDIGFQSPNVEAAKPMVFVTTFLLVLVVLAMTSVAVALRTRMRKKYASKSF